MSHPANSLSPPIPASAAVVGTLTLAVGLPGPSAFGRDTWAVSPQNWAVSPQNWAVTPQNWASFRALRGVERLSFPLRWDSLLIYGLTRVLSV